MHVFATILLAIVFAALPPESAPTPEGVPAIQTDPAPTLDGGTPAGRGTAFRPGHTPAIEGQGASEIRDVAIQQDTSWEGCSYRGFELHGKVQIVEAFPDIKVQVVEAFPDVRVKWVTTFPDDCGEWQEVDAFPDFKIQIVDAFPDVKIQEVDAFPGLVRGG